MSYAQFLLDFANNFIKEAEIDLNVANKLLSDIDLSKCESDEEVFGIGRRILYNLQQASEKAIKASIFVVFKPIVRIITSIGITEEGTDAVDRCKIPVEQLRDLDEMFKPEKIGHLPPLAFICLINEVIGLKDFITCRISVSLERLVRKHLISRRDKLNIKSYLSQISEMLSLEGGVREEIKDICRAWQNRNWKEVRRRLGFSIPCIENKLRILAKLHLPYTKERSPDELYRSMSKVKSQKAKALGLKEAEGVIEAALEWYKNSMDSIPLINHVINHAFTLSSCLSLYESIGRYPSDAQSGISVFERRNEICKDIKNAGNVIDELKTLTNDVRILVKNIGPRLLELESL